MAVFNIKDILLDEDMDLVIENGDLKIADEPLALVQSAIFRVLTSPLEWRPDSGAMAGLERHAGSPNNEETYNRIKNDIQRALAKEFLLAPADYDVIIYPHTEFPDQISITLRIKNIEYVDQNEEYHTGEEATISFRLHLSTGKLSYIDSQ